MRVFKICWILIQHFGFWSNVECDLQKVVNENGRKTWMFFIFDNRTRSGIDISLFDRMKKANLLRENLSVLDDNPSPLPQPQPNLINPGVVVSYDYPDVTEIKKQ